MYFALCIMCIPYVCIKTLVVTEKIKKNKKLTRVIVNVMLATRERVRATTHIGQSGTKSCITDGLHVFPHAAMSRERGKLEISNHAVLQASVLVRPILRS